MLTPDELKSIPKGEFVVMKTGKHPMRTKLRLFLDWGISFEEPYILPERTNRTVRYAGREELERAIEHAVSDERAEPSSKRRAHHFHEFDYADDDDHPFKV